jgi:hypothetical protein
MVISLLMLLNRMILFTQLTHSHDMAWYVLLCMIDDTIVVNGRVPQLAHSNHIMLIRLDLHWIGISRRHIGYFYYDIEVLMVWCLAGYSGCLHPLLKVRTEIRKFLLEMGFTEMPTNNFVESSFWNFDALFQPQQVIFIIGIIITVVHVAL